MNWPNVADGDVLRRMEASGFDFTKPQEIDFMIDFKSWPPDAKAVEILSAKFGDVELFDPDDEGAGYALVKVTAKVGYELVMHYQEEISLIMGAYDGWCESWGAFSNA